MDQITLVAKFHTDGSVSFERLNDPTENSGSGFLAIHIHGKPGIAVSISDENLEEKRLSVEQIDRLRDALNAEIVRYGHSPLPPNAFQSLRKD